MIRSLGGWSDVKKLSLKGMDRLKGDECILGDTGFVQSILALAKEHFERYYEMQRLGYDLNTVPEKAALIYGIDSAELSFARDVRNRGLTQKRCFVIGQIAS